MTDQLIHTKCEQNDSYCMIKEAVCRYKTMTFGVTISLKFQHGTSDSRRDI